MNILVAPNAFKNCMDADDVASAIIKGLGQSKLNCTCKSFPIGDGGDGTALLIAKYFKAGIKTCPVYGPLGRITDASYFISGDRNAAIIELASASGLKLLVPNEYDVLNATTFGTGQLISDALDEKVNKIIFCIGGSATVDGGIGILQALGIKFKDSSGKDLLHIPLQLSALCEIDPSGIDQRILQTEIIILCDVQIKLLGHSGSAVMFGPQKGAGEDDIRILESGLNKFSEITYSYVHKNMSEVEFGGAAGGTAAGMWAWLNARLVRGIDFFLDQTNFSKALEKASLLITAEGRLDLQTLEGKGPFGVALRAKQKKIPTIILAGSVSIKGYDELSKYFDVILPVINQPLTLEEAIRNCSPNLTGIAQQVGNMLALNNIFKMP